MLHVSAAGFLLSFLVTNGLFMPFVTSLEIAAMSAGAAALVYLTCKAGRLAITHSRKISRLSNIVPS